MEEISLKLGFAVLFAIDEAFLADDCGVIVTCVSAWVSEIAPWEKLVMIRGWPSHRWALILTVSTAISHVQVEDGNALCKVVLV